MKVEVMSKKVICSNEHSLHGYFGWPTVARLRNGRLAMVASGFRLGHLCQFGKCVISYSDDEGRTWSLPAAVIDTPLDDRDGGITAFGKSSVIVTSFTRNIKGVPMNCEGFSGDVVSYLNRYADFIEKSCDWEKYLGSTYRISNDNGVTFGQIMKIPVTCPHGPVEMPDGSLLYVGRKFSPDDKFRTEKHLSCYKVFPDGSYEFLCEIDNVSDTLFSCEPHAVVLENGKVIVHIRVQDAAHSVFTIYQCESYDGGKSFTKPHRLLSERGGSPAHIINHKGTLVSVYGYRNAPYGIRAMFSKDGGETWDCDNVLVDDGPCGDLGYPASVALEDGSILTVYYAKMEKNSPAVIMQVIWKYCG